MVLVVFLPAAIFYYEAYDDVEVQGKRALAKDACSVAVRHETGLLVVASLALAIMCVESLLRCKTPAHPTLTKHTHSGTRS